jgi:transcription elongation factor GreA
MARDPMTMQGYEALKAELDQLKGPERHRIATEIEAARELGDLSENAEYHAAKDRQAQIEAQIRRLEDLLSNAEIVDTSILGGERVKFGARVTLEDIDSGKTAEYRIVGVGEADISRGTISYTSPMARGLMNHEVGDEVRVQVPGGVRTYEIVEISWD